MLVKSWFSTIINNARGDSALTVPWYLKLEKSVTNRFYTNIPMEILSTNKYNENIVLPYGTVNTII
jgi:hypothetical protein